MKINENKTRIISQNKYLGMDIIYQKLHIGIMSTNIAKRAKQTIINKQESFKGRKHLHVRYTSFLSVIWCER